MKKLSIQIIALLCLTLLGWGRVWGQGGLYEICSETHPPHVTVPSVICEPRFTICCNYCAAEPLHLINEMYLGAGCTDYDNCDNCYNDYLSSLSKGCVTSPTSLFRWSISPGGWTYVTPYINRVAPPGSLFTPGGTYTVTLEVFEPSGGTPISNSATITLPLDLLGTPSFTWTPAPACTGDAVTFTNTTSGYALTSWNFGDPASGAANTSGMDNPTHTFSGPGSYLVTMIVVSTGTNYCADTLQQIVNVAAPKAEFWWSGFCEDFTTTFYSTSTCADDYLWTFGDGTISTLPNPTHTYSTPGTYLVTLAINGGTVTTSAVVTIHPTPAPVITGPATTCTSFTGTYAVTGMPGSTYSWTALGGIITPPSTGTSVTVNWGFGYGDLIVTETSANGCVGSDTFHVALCCTVPGATNLPDGGTASALIAAAGTSLFTGTTFTVNGTWTVDANLNWVACDVRLGRDAKIIVQGGRTLDIAGGILQSCGGFMWDGIYLLNSTATLRTTNNLRVQDAQQAVVSQNGGHYDLSTTTFDLNRRAVVVQPFGSSHTGVMAGVTFTCSNPALMLFPHAGERGLCGVQVDRVQAISLGTASVATCTYSGQLVYGILADRSNVTVENNSFSGIQPITTPTVIPGTGIAIRARGIPGTSLGLTPYTLSVGQNVSGYRNTFTNCHQGIEVSDNLHANIRGNTFTTAGFEAMRLQNNNLRNILISDNTITNAWVGIHSLFNRASGITIERNILTATGGLDPNMGIAIEGMTGSALLVPANVAIRNNTLGIRGTGILVQSFRRVTMTQNTITIVPYAGVECYGIRVLGSRNATAHNNTLTSSAASNQLVRGIHIENSAEATVTCNSLTRFGRHIIFNGSCANSQVLRNVMQHGFFGLVIQDGGVIGSQGSAGSPSDNKWLGSWVGSKARIESSPSASNVLFVRSGATYSPSLSFIGGPSSFSLSGTSGPFITCPPLSTTGSTLSGILLRDIANDAIPYAAMEAQNRRLAKQYLKRTLEENPAVAVADPVLSGWLAGDGLGYLPLSQTEDLTDTASVEAAALANTGLVPATTHEANRQQVIGIYLETVPALASLSAAQQGTLEGIAALCPIEGGQAVYQAQALLNLAGYRGPVVGYGDCGGESEKWEGEVVEDPVKMSAVTLYPNPARESATLVLALEPALADFQQEATAEVLDIQGRVLLTITLRGGQDAHEINLQELPQGVYLVRVMQEGEQLGAVRLAVVR